jgi:predicted PurR-regulated permease PerM
MSDVGKSRNASSWLTFAGWVLVVAVLYWGQAVLMPIALAALLTFVLAAPVTWLQRWVGRTIAVLVTVGLVFALMGAAMWGLGSQLAQLADDLPRYRTNIRQKIGDVRQVGSGSVEKLQETISVIQTEIDKTQPSRRAPTAVVRRNPVSVWDFSTWISPAMGSLGTAGLVVILVIFMLLEREQLRGKLIELIGSSHMALTTKALDEAGQRVSRQLLMQTLVNAIYGVMVAATLYVLEVPYPILFGVTGGALRYIPYVGPLLGAGLPFLVSLAALPGWTGPLWVAGIFVVIEAFTNMVLETVLYADAAGVSQVALLIAVAFWTWLWGPIGLLLATPLTVCVVVVGRHMPGLDFLSMLMADAPALTSDVGFYQRVLARDQSEAAELIEKWVAEEPPGSVYDALLLPALNYLKRDRLQDRLSAEEESAAIETTRELMADAAARAQPAPSEGEDEDEDGDRLVVAAYAVGGAPDELAIRMLERVLEHDRVSLEVATLPMLASEMVATVRTQAPRVACLVDLPPSRPSKTRYVVHRLRAAAPDLTIVVCRWSVPTLADDDPASLIQAGANHVSTSLADTRNYLRGLAPAALART